MADMDTEYIEDVSLTDDLVVSWILQSRLAAPVVRRQIDDRIEEMPVEYYARVRQRIGRKERTIADVSEPWRSSDYADLSDDELLPAAAPLRSTLRLGLLETPSTGACRVEFARTKGGAKFWATSWFEGWGEALVLDGDNADKTPRGGRTPELVKADSNANLSASLSSTAQVLTRVNAHITAHSIEAAKAQGIAIGQAQSLLPVIDHLRNRAELAESRLENESAWKAVSDSVGSVVGVVNTFAGRPDLPQLLMLGHQMLAEVTKQQEQRAQQSKQANEQQNIKPAQQVKPDRAWLASLLRRVVADGVVSAPDLVALANEVAAEPLN